MKFFVAFKDDYRFKNLFCFFELTELNNDELLAKATHLKEV